MSKIQGTLRAEASKQTGLLKFMSKPIIVKVYTDGIYFNNKGDEYEYLWSELDEFYQLEAMAIQVGSRKINQGVYDIRLIMSDGREIALDSKFDGIEAVSDQLRRVTVQPLLDRAKDELAKNNETQFGEYILTNEGFRHNSWSIDKQIAWDTIINIGQMGPAYVINYKHPEKPDEQAMLPLPPMNKLPNAGVLISLIQTFVAQHHQKSGE